MSQSRSRKTQSFGGENSGKARSSVVKDSGDAGHSVHHQNQPKTKQNSRTKNKIPKSIRYDLDNALVSLCDVWFDDIKPHLLRNKIKLHVDNSGSTTTARGDCRRMQKDAPGCSHHDPGSGSDCRQQTPANFAAFSPPPPTASKVRFVSQSTCRPQSPIHSRLGPTTQNKNIKIKSPKGPREEVQPRSPPPPVAGRPRLCRSCQPSDLSPRTNKRRIHTTPSVYTRDNVLPFPRKLLKKHKKSQTNITWVHYKSTYYKTVNPASYTVFPKNTNVSVSKNRNARVQQRQRPKIKCPYSEITNPVKQLTTEYSHKNKLSSSTVKSTKYRPTSPRVLKKLTEELPVDTIKIAQSRNQNRSREKKPNTNSVMFKKRTGERKVDPSIASEYYDTDDKSNSQLCRCFATSATTNLNQAKNKECVKNQKISDTDCNVIFDQDLIDIIGTENDKRLRILYNSPMIEESNSVLNLLPSLGQQIPEERSKRKNVPWR